MVKSNRIFDLSFIAPTLCRLFEFQCLAIDARAGLEFLHRRLACPCRADCFVPAERAAAVSDSPMVLEMPVAGWSGSLWFRSTRRFDLSRLEDFPDGISFFSKLQCDRSGSAGRLPGELSPAARSAKLNFDFQICH